LGLVVFAAILLGLIGFFNLIDGMGLPVLVADHHRRRHRGDLGTVRLWQPREHRSRRLTPDK
jgi:hypothetical protein